jgi:hypothetical protein
MLFGRAADVWVCRFQLAAPVLAISWFALVPVIGAASLCEP